MQTTQTIRPTTAALVAIAIVTMLSIVGQLGEVGASAQEGTEPEDQEIQEEQDLSAPMISGASISLIQQTSAEIQFTTNEEAVVSIEYGTESGRYIAATPETTEAVTSYTGILTGLTEGTTYYYRAKARDASENYGYSTESTFTTKSAPGAVRSASEESSTEPATEEGGEEPPISSDQESQAQQPLAPIGTTTQNGAGETPQPATTPAEFEEPETTEGQVVLLPREESAPEDEQEGSTLRAYTIVLGVIALLVIAGIGVVLMSRRQ